jgi:hypothetical protein
MNKKPTMEQLRDRVRHEHQMPTKRRKYWWVSGFTKLGKPIFRGCWPEDKEQDAHQWGLANTNGTYELHLLSYSNQADATREWKAIRGDETGDIDEAIKRVRHRGKDLGID